MSLALYDVVETVMKLIQLLLFLNTGYLSDMPLTLIRFVSQIELFSVVNYCNINQYFYGTIKSSHSILHKKFMKNDLFMRFSI